MAELSTYRVAGVEIHLDGARLRARQVVLSRDEDAIDFDTREFPDSVRSTYTSEVNVVPRASVRVVVRGWMRPRATDSRLYGATKTRHPMLGINAAVDRREWAFDLRPLREWSDVPVRFRVSRAPRNWRLSATQPAAERGPSDVSGRYDHQRAESMTQMPAEFWVSGDEDVQWVELRTDIFRLFQILSVANKVRGL